MKKIARCQNQDRGKGKKDGENGEKSKSKSPSVKNGDDSESDLSFTGNDNAITGTITYKFVPLWSDSMLHYMGRVNRIWYLSPMRAAKVQASLRIRAVSPESPLLAHTSSESRGPFRQKARSLALLNGWACAVKICHDGMLEDRNSLDASHIM